MNLDIYLRIKCANVPPEYLRAVRNHYMALADKVMRGDIRGLMNSRGAHPSRIPGLKDTPGSLDEYSYNGYNPNPPTGVVGRVADWAKDKVMLAHALGNGIYRGITKARKHPNGISRVNYTVNEMTPEEYANETGKTAPKPSTDDDNMSDEDMAKLLGL